MTTTTCPSHEDLTEYLSGRLGAADWDDIGEHLEACPECQAMLATLDAAGDTLVAALRRAAPKDPYFDESQCRVAIGRAHSMFDAASADDSSPQTLCGRSLGEYLLTEELGRGGMGRVYKALHTKLDRVVAVKVLSGGRAGDENAANRFAREMKAVGRLVHPNIVQAYDAREIDGTSVLIMELVDGLDLAKIVGRWAVGVPALAGENKAPAEAETPAVGRGIPVPDACELVRQTALALECAHEHGLVHRDIKPSNIMLARSGVVKLLDLGLARFFAASGADLSSTSHVEEMTGTGQAIGTADYMAPEQASDSRTVDIRADIYSLGCTLYKLLTGRAPFSGPEYRTALDKMHAHVHQPVPPIRSIAPEVPEGLSAVVDRMLAKEPCARFATPAEVAQAIAPFCAGADLAALLAWAETTARAGGEFASPDHSVEGAVGVPALAGKNKAPAKAGTPTVKFIGQLLLPLAASGLVVAMAIMLHIHKDGKDTTIGVPEGGRAQVRPDGQVDITLPAQAQSTSAAAAAGATGPEKTSAVTEIGQPPEAVTRGRGGSRGKGGFGGAAAAGPNSTAPPTVRVTQPVVCDVCDYEEYAGKIIDGPVAIHFPFVGKYGFHAANLEIGMTVREGDLLGEMAPYKDPEVQEAVQAINDAEDARTKARRSKDATRIAEAEANLKAVGDALKQAEADVPRVKVVAPISGKLSNTHGRGVYGPGFPFNSIEVPDSMVVTFDIPERAVLAHRRLPDRKPNWLLSLPIACGLADDKGYPYRGKVVSVAEAINPETHTQHWAAVVPNKDGLFMPGMSVRVRLITAEPHKVMLIPPKVWSVSNHSSNVGPEDDSRLLLVVNEHNVLESKTVALGQQYDDLKVVTGGLNANDWIVLNERNMTWSDSNGRLKISFNGEWAAVGDIVTPEKVTTSPPPWAAISVPVAVSVARPIARQVSDYEDYTGRVVEGPPRENLIPAEFEIDERTVIRLRRSMAGQKPGWEHRLPVSCGLADDEGFPIRGEVSVVQDKMDPKTGTQLWSMVLLNKDGVLVPGMFLRVRLTVSAPYRALLIPERAMGFDQGRKFVFVVNRQDAAERRDLKVGQLQDDGLMAVTEGLSGQDRVILNPSKVKAGMFIKPEEQPHDTAPRD